MVDARALQSALEDADFTRFRAVLMPNASVDHLVFFPRLDDIARALDPGASEENVDVHAVRQVLRPGGGPVHTGHALARLGVRTHLIARTSDVGRHFLESTLARDGVDLSRVRGDGTLAVTGAIEAPGRSVMLETPRPQPMFGPEDLEDADHALIRASDAVYVGHWVNPRAEDLARVVCEEAKAHGARTFTDAGAPRIRGARRARILAALAASRLDAISVNTAEVSAYVPDAIREDEPERERLLAAGRALSRRVSARVDLHANALTASFRKGTLVARAPSWNVRPKQATGAGDAWNAGLIAGDLLGLPTDQCLLLANALASAYVASADAEPPTLAELRAFMEETPLEEESVANA